MITKVYTIDPHQINRERIGQAAGIIHQGGLVAIPTETVYGLAADGLNEQAVKKIYLAKGRPSDNPLILHISDRAELPPLVAAVPPSAEILMDKFWPGPMTLIFKKSSLVSATVSGGLDTVAIRLPSHPVARALIQASKTPLAAPSANTSGRPSPTKAAHVYEDLNGRIEMILDGGDCEIGLESTVIDVTGAVPLILRPGKVTLEDLVCLLGNAAYDRHLVDHSEAVVPKSPGMKYKHYAPRGQVMILEGPVDAARRYIAANQTPSAAVFTFDEFPFEGPHVYSLGSVHDPGQGSSRLFDCLRRCDAAHIRTIFALSPPTGGMGFALYNRLFKAAGGKVVTLKEDGHEI